MEAWKQMTVCHQRERLGPVCSIATFWKINPACTSVLEYQPSELWDNITLCCSSCPTTALAKQFRCCVIKALWHAINMTESLKMPFWGWEDPLLPRLRLHHWYTLINWSGQWEWSFLCKSIIFLAHTHPQCPVFCWLSDCKPYLLAWST